MHATANANFCTHENACDSYCKLLYISKCMWQLLQIVVNIKMHVTAIANFCTCENACDSYCQFFVHTKIHMKMHVTAIANFCTYENVSTAHKYWNITLIIWSNNIVSMQGNYSIQWYACCNACYIRVYIIENMYNTCIYSKIIHAYHSTQISYMQISYVEINK